MYRQTRIPRLCAILWASIPEPVQVPDPAVSAVGGSLTEVASTSLEATSSGAPRTSTSGLSSSAHYLIVPDGCMDLIVVDSQVLIAGADSTARIFTGSSEPVVGLRFDPGVLPQLLTTSAAELADRVTPVEAVITRDSVLGLSCSSGIGSAGRGMIGDGVRRLLAIAESLSARTALDRRPLVLAGRLSAGPTAPAGSVAEVAAELAYSPRHLRRLSAAWFGYGPKHLAKILRWQAARELIDAGHTRTSAAVGVGYSDAAHLWRDERSLLGR